MSERLRYDERDPVVTDLEDGILPDVDLDPGSESETSGGDDLALTDEENMYGNDVLVGPEDDED